MTKKKKIHIDLNSDLGEHPGSPLDGQIMPYLSSCNIACGGHVGNEESVRDTILLARKYQVAIGAHPSYPDRKNFGREILEIQYEDLVSSFRQQIELVRSIGLELNEKLHHIKAHGALYNEVAKNKVLSQLICDCIKDIDCRIKLYGLAHSSTESVAKKNGITFVAEGFADRTYEADKSLMSRKKAGAVILKEKKVLAQVEELVINQRVYSEDWISIQAQTICLHSDTQGAVNLAGKIRQHLESKGVQIISV